MAPIAGGVNSDGNILASAEQYDCESKTWSGVAAMSVPRDLFSLVQLTNGNFLALSGMADRNSLICSVKMGSWALPDRLQTAKVDFEAVGLLCGKVSTARRADPPAVLVHL